MQKLELKKTTILSTVNFLTFLLIFIGHSLFTGIVLLTFILIHLHVNKHKITELINTSISAYPFFVILIYCTITGLWSDWPMVVYKSVLIQSLFLILVILMVLGSDIRGLINQAAIAAAAVVVLNLLAIPIEGGFFNSYSGIYSHKNNLGLVMLITSLLLFSSNMHKTVKTFFISLALILLLASQSKTSVLLLFLIVLSFNYFNTLNGERYSKVLKTTFVLIFILGSSLLVIKLDVIYIYILNNLDAEFLTGRGLIWLTMLEHTGDRILYGLGYNAVWGQGEYSEIYFTPLYKTHPIWVENLSFSDGGYIDILIAIGVVGFVLVMWLIGKTYLAMTRILDQQVKFVVFGLVTLAVFHNITETTFLQGFNIVWFLFILVSVYSLHATSQRKVLSL